jgi:peptidase E
MEPENPLLDDFILSLSRRTPARVCFIPTASADSHTYIARFYRAFVGRCLPTDLTIFDPPALPRQPAHTADLPAFVSAQDVFYVGGGNTANLLAIWRTHGLDRLLARAWRSGAVLAGISAGMLCWFQDGLSDSFGGYEPLGAGLGLLRGAACPHYDGEPLRRDAFRRMIARHKTVGYAADDGAALHFAGRRLREVVSSRPEARAYQLALKNGAVVETRLETRFLARPVKGKKAGRQ